MASHSAPRSESQLVAVSHSPIIDPAPDALSRLKNSPTESSTSETTLTNASRVTSPVEFELNSNSSTVYGDANTESKVHEVPPSKVTIRQALGIYSTIILAGGTIVILGTLSFLIFLWFGKGPDAGGENATPAWRMIMLRDWLPQVITLASVAIRVAIAAQIAVCTSMCAALILERRRVRKSQAARFSVARCVNDGPWSLILAFLTDVPTQTFFHPESVLVVFLGLATLATQFTSTILLSDLGDTSLALFPSTMRLNLTAENNSYSLGQPYWGQRPRSFASFGESPPGYSSQPNQRGLSDTGLKRRAFLPFSDEGNRTSLRGYEGQAFVLNSRVACMPPLFSDSQFKTMNYSDRFYYGAIEGNLQYNETFAKAGIHSSRLCNSERCLPSSFGCHIFTLGEDWGVTKPEITFCFPELIDVTSGSPSYWGLDDDPWGPEASTILVISSDLKEEYWSENLGKTIPTPNYTVNEEWANFELQPGYSVNISLCFMGLNVMQSDVSLVSKSAKTANTAERNANTVGEVIDTTDIQVLLGADPKIQSLAEREVFEIDRIEDSPEHVFLTNKNDSLPGYQQDTSALESYLISTAQALTPNSTIAVCDPCTGYSTQSANTLYGSIFSGIIERTNRAAVALQSVYTVLAQTVYYDVLEVYDESYEAHVTLSRTAKVPKQASGLIAVIVLTISSLIAIGIMTALFCRHAHYTLLGETWHTLSQVVSPDTEALIHGEGIIPDGNVEKNLKGEDHYVKLQRSPGTGRVEVTLFDMKD
ncbi:hypothetical protein F5B22DRAFT_624576 [Xylaria bambusicola]|uniref:uncharacterized protein n=1 Tax=Xylaria bambusicola TaxID=326684 RepID=UPI0020089277|nr:uncharacterized protein F5B22DRAFT_624576 [Xylaria bambusicola]KAI0506208.1 hypothetical protein F5B22DRAFT_624576 [Xylaria bambusicola]